MQRLDLAIFQAIHNLWGTNRLLDSLGVFVANTLTYLMIAGMGVFILVTGHSVRERLFLASEMFLAFILARGIMATTISATVDRARPFEALLFMPPFLPMTAAFPSGHMAGLFAVVPVMLAVNFRWGIVYLALSLLVGLGRIFAGVHWPSDILGGIAVGLLAGFAIHYLVRPAREALAGQASGGAGLGMDNGKPSEE